MRRLMVMIIACTVTGCSGDSSFDGECKRDTDCEAFERCDLLDHRCVCGSDEACALGEYCNASGSCQRKTGCLTNLDCAGGDLCDIETGECIGPGTCTRDYHCDIGQVCTEGLCRAGCRDTGDCDLMNREVCVEYECRFGLCENNSYCEVGRVCNPQTHACELPEGPHCLAGCSRTCVGCTDKTQGPCGDPVNVCAGMDPDTYCWVGCAGHADCPAGFLCLPTSVTWSPVCESALDCTVVPPEDDRVINVCDGEGAAARCRLSKQPCDVDADCHPFETTCLANQCVFAYHCRLPGDSDGCP